IIKFSRIPFPLKYANEDSSEAFVILMWTTLLTPASFAALISAFVLLTALSYVICLYGKRTQYVLYRVAAPSRLFINSRGLSKLNGKASTRLLNIFRRLG